MREQSFFQTGEKYQREFQALGGVERHQRDLRAFFVGIGVADQGGVVEELIESFATVFGIHGGVY